VVHESVPMRRAAPLFWQVCLINGAVFVLGTAALALSPAKVSSEVLLSEAVVLVVGLAVLITVNALLLRPSLSPLDRLTGLMASVDLLQPGQRLEESGSGTVARVVSGFNAMLGRLERERGESVARALSAQEAERTRIAQELHDEVGQSLTALLLGLDRTSSRAPARLQPELRALRETTRTALDEVRRVAQGLRPGVLEDLGLVSALAALAGDFQARTGVVVVRDVEPGLPSLDREAELVLYRVAQEALTNAARHAGASAVRLALVRRDARVVLRVTDDGRGLGTAPDGAGIRGMRERALLVGADLTLGSQLGGGTEVRLVLPAVRSGA